MSLESLSAATTWVDSYAKPMAERVYGNAALPESEQNAAILARYIVKQRLTQLNKRELKRSPHRSALPQLSRAEKMNEAVERLVEAGWLQEHFGRCGDRPGRQEQTYLVNPAVHRDDRGERDK